LDGEHIPAAGARRTVVLHKPRGVLSTLADPEGRPTVAALAAGAGRLYPVGRLDLNSTGLLLLTNDGALAAGLLHPRRAVTRVYHVKVDGTPSEEAITRLRRGVRLADGKTAPAHVRVLERLPTKTWLAVTVVEGRTHLVRRLCEAVGHRVDRRSACRSVRPAGSAPARPASTPQATATRTAVASAMRATAAACPKPPMRRRSTTKRRPKLPSATAEVASASPTCPKPSRRTKSQLRA